MAAVPVGLASSTRIVSHPGYPRALSPIRRVVRGRGASAARLASYGFRFPHTGTPRSMFLLWKRPGKRTQIRFMPGCLVISIIASVVLTVLLNLLIRAF